MIQESMPIYIINHEETTMLLFQFLLGCVYNMGTRFTTLWSYHVATHNSPHTIRTIQQYHIYYTFREIQNLKI